MTRIAIASIAALVVCSVPLFAGEPPPGHDGKAQPVNGELDKAIEKQLQDWRAGNAELNRLRQQQLDADTRKMTQDVLDRFKQDEAKRQAEDLRRQAAHRLLDAVIYGAVALGVVIWMVLKLQRKRSPQGADQPPDKGE